MRKQTTTILTIIVAIFALLSVTVACDSRQDYMEEQADKMPTPSEERAEQGTTENEMEQVAERAAEEMGLDEADQDESESEGSAEGEQHADMDNVLDEGEYNPDEVVRQPGAEVGDIAQCPVGGEVFRVTDEATYVDTDDGRVYFCCPNCIRRFQRDPQRYLDTQDVAPDEQ